MTNWIVRDATAGDVSGMAEAWVAAWESAYRGLLPDEVIDARPLSLRKTQLHDQLTKDGPLLVCENAGAIAGFAHFGARRIDGQRVGSEGELYALYVHPNVWRGGAGSALCTEAERRLRALGYSSAVLWVLQANARARAFYEKYGWTVESVGPPGNYGDREVLYRKPFSS